MKRFFSALAFCVFLLSLLSFVLFPPVRAKEDPIATLLDLPAPPPINPLVTGYRTRDKKFYDKYSPPGDGAPIDEVLDYWKAQSESYTDLGYNPKPSDRNAERIMAEIDKDHDLLPQYLNALPDGERSANFVRGIYDSEGKSGVLDRDERASIKTWLTYHTSMFSNELASAAEQIRDADEYITSQNELLALTRVDFDRAQPIVSRMYSDSSQKVSKALATWALYRRALDTDSIGDIDRYRDELKAIVEDKSASPGMRDLAFDALCKEKEWSGRDEWYYSLMADETLADLRVNGSSYTGVTTLMSYGPDDKYVDKMLELLKSGNKTVRAAAIRNLLLKLDTGNIEVIRAMVPWLEDPKWADDVGNSRATLIGKLSEFEIPESVPGLIKLLDEKQPKVVPAYSSANMAANAANTVAMAVNAITRAAARANSNVAFPSSSPSLIDTVIAEGQPYRDMAVLALVKQKDASAAPALRRILPDGEYYQQTNVIRALIACKGFSITEQVDAIETSAKGVRAELDGQPVVDPLSNLYSYANHVANSNTYSPPRSRALTPLELRILVGRELANSTEITDELARAVVERIEVLDKTNKPLAEAFRKMALRWQSSVISLLMLRDVKRGIADSETMLKLLAQRKEIREKLSTDIFDIKTGTPTAAGVATCLLEDQADAAAIVENGDNESKTALLACARLIRLPLPVEKVAANLTSPLPILVTAAERYLESEDSPAARSIVLSRHPGEARILGASSAFFPNDKVETTSEMLWGLFQSMGNDSLYNGWSGSGNDEEIKQLEKRLQDEVKKTDDLVGIYAYDSNFVRIYKNKVVYSWEEDASRFRERPMTKPEFDGIKAYITDNKLDEAPPFLGCGGDYCTAKELIMLGRNGGRRVYYNGESTLVFTGLEKYFAELRQTPGTLKYTLSKEIPGLEVVIASDDLHVETVWKEGNDLRVAASLTAVRKKVEDEVEKVSDEEDPSNGTEDVETRKQKIRDKREYDGFGWYTITGSGAEPGAAQPAGVEFVPIRDGLGVPAGSEQWKTRAPGFEIRSSEDGMFKVVRGRMTKVRPGHYENPVVTPNGRWVVATKIDPEASAVPVRIDLVTNKEYPVEVQDRYNLFASAYVPTINKVLLATSNEYYGDEYYNTDTVDDTVPEDADPEQMLLLDPATGVTQPLAGEFRPFNQQTFRPLESAGRPNEFWAAMPDSEKNETQIGIYETRTFSFKAVLRVPKIKFNSMSMYVDEPGNKVYFVYRGHLLSLPLKK